MRAVDCDGGSSVSNTLKALDWLYGNAQHPAVAVLALGSHKVEPVLDTAVAALITQGIIAVTAAGNAGSGEEQPLCHVKLKEIQGHQL